MSALAFLLLAKRLELTRQTAKDTDVAAALCSRFQVAAAAAIEERGQFCVAVPGGSVLAMLAGLPSYIIDWSKVVLAYVNHKCLPLDDEKATHAKAVKLFLSASPGVTVIVPTGGPDASQESQLYASKLAAEKRLPKSNSGTPIFDLMLLGMGSDGHIGSLYPGKPEVLRTSTCVLGVQKSSGPGSITLSLETMNAARSVIIAMTGASKGEAVRTCLEDTHKPGDFPAAMVSCPGGMTWLLDEGAASKLAAGNGVSKLM